MLGVSKAVFAKWRKAQGLSANYPKQRAPGKPRRTPSPQEPANDALTVRRMAEIFGQMAEWHPDAVVSVPAGTDTTASGCHSAIWPKISAMRRTVRASLAGSWGEGVLRGLPGARCLG